MAAKLTTCKVCGAEIAASAKACPQCGAKNKKPFYKKWWFWLIVVILLLGAAGGGSEEAEAPQEETTAAVSAPQETSAEAPPEAAEPAEPEPEEITYTHYPVTELLDLLSSNALKAEKTFQDQYVEIEGYLSVIDSDGKYISIGADPDDYEYLFQNVQCFIKKNEALLDQILEMNVGDPLVVRGKITEIGEVLGYQMDLDSIN